MGNRFSFLGENDEAESCGGFVSGCLNLAVRRAAGEQQVAGAPYLDSLVGQRNHDKDWQGGGGRERVVSFGEGVGALMC